MPKETKIGWEKTWKDYVGKATREEREEDSLSLVVHMNVIKKMKVIGCKFLLSQDASNIFQVPGFGLLEEMKLFQKVGFTNAEILRMVTEVPAEFFGESDKWGRIKEGYRANLIMFNANPLDNIENIGKIEGVLLATKWLKREFLNEQIKSYIK